MLQLDLAQGVGRSASDRIKRHARGGGTASLVSEMDGRNAAAQGSKQLVIAKSGYAARGVLDPRLSEGPQGAGGYSVGGAADKTGPGVIFKSSQAHS